MFFRVNNSVFNSNDIPYISFDKEDRKFTIYFRKNFQFKSSWWNKIKDEHFPYYEGILETLSNQGDAPQIIKLSENQINGIKSELQQHIKESLVVPVPEEPPYLDSELKELLGC